MPDRKVMVYIAASVDGYIAGVNDDMGFLSVASKEGEDYGYADFIDTVDTVIMGRRTYDWVFKQDYQNSSCNTSNVCYNTPGKSASRQGPVLFRRPGRSYPEDQKVSR